MEMPWSKIIRSKMSWLKILRSKTVLWFTFEYHKLWTEKEKEKEKEKKKEPEKVRFVMICYDLNHLLVCPSRQTSPIYIYIYICMFVSIFFQATRSMHKWLITRCPESSNDLPSRGLVLAHREDAHREALWGMGQSSLTGWEIGR